ncbi:flavin-binding monooxygenase-like family protein [Paraphaeosphaeria sporulosa]
MALALSLALSHRLCVYLLPSALVPTRKPLPPALALSRVLAPNTCTYDRAFPYPQPCRSADFGFFIQLRQELHLEVEEAHLAETVKRAPYFSAIAGCTPGYFNGYGAIAADPVAKKKAAWGATWSEGTRSFLKYIGDWRQEGEPRALEVTLRPAIEVERARLGGGPLRAR